MSGKKKCHKFLKVMKNYVFLFSHDIISVVDNIV